MLRTLRLKLPIALFVTGIICFLVGYSWELHNVLQEVFQNQPDQIDLRDQLKQPGSRPPQPETITPKSTSKDALEISLMKHSPGDPPYSYPDEVHLRLIVITYKRSESLQKLLQSIDDLQLESKTAALEIWVDYPIKTNNGPAEKRKETIEVAKAFTWKKGPKTVHLWESNAGLRGQWIDTWRPHVNTTEIALILEDDLTLSPYAFKWLRAAFGKYRKREDMAGVTLMSQEVAAASNLAPLKTPKDDMAYMYQWPSSWALAPHPDVWRRFQDWYHVTKNQPDFHPHTPNTRTWQWYHSAEVKNKTSTIWTQWYIYYCYANQLYCVFPNIHHQNKSDDTLLVLNRKESGLHSKGQFTQFTEDNLLRRWDDRFGKLPPNPLRYDLYGNVVNETEGN